MYTFALAYAGTSNNDAIQYLLHLTPCPLRCHALGICVELVCVLFHDRDETAQQRSSYQGCDCHPVYSKVKVRKKNATVEGLYGDMYVSIKASYGLICESRKRSSLNGNISPIEGSLPNFTDDGALDIAIPANGRYQPVHAVSTKRRQEQRLSLP